MIKDNLLEATEIALERKFLKQQVKKLKQETEQLHHGQEKEHVHNGQVFVSA